MAAHSIVRNLLCVLLALAVVLQVAVAPVAAGDDDGVDIDVGGISVGVGGDDDGTTVGDDGGGGGIYVPGADVNDSETNVSVNGTLECSTSPTDPALADACETDTDGGAGAPDATAPDAPAPEPDLDPDAVEPGATTPELPIDYSDIPLDAIPYDLCSQPVGLDDVPEYQPPPEPVPDPFAQLPVSPSDLPVGMPVTQCDVFDPYSPPFDPTDTPDNPGADAREPRVSAGADGVRVVLYGEGQVDDDWPAVSRAILYVVAGPDGVRVGDYGDADDGSRRYGADTDVTHAPGTKEGAAEAEAIAIGRAAGAAIVCDGEQCRATTDGVPSATLPPVPTGGGDGGESDTVPCEAPVAPGDAPAPPEDVPEDPRDDVPRSEIGPCDVVDPNDPPMDPENPPRDPDAGARDPVVNAGADGASAVLHGEGTTGEGGPTVERGIWYAVADSERVRAGQYATATDGGKYYRLNADAVYTVDDRNDTVEVDGRLFGSDVGAAVVCSGADCASDSDVPVTNLPSLEETDDVGESRSSGSAEPMWAGMEGEPFDTSAAAPVRLPSAASRAPALWRLSAVDAGIPPAGVAAATLRELV